MRLRPVLLALGDALAVLQTLDAIVTTLDAWWSDAPDEVASGWRRDRALLTVARGAREARRVKAWAMLRG